MGRDMVRVYSIGMMVQYMRVIGEIIMQMVGVD